MIRLTFRLVIRPAFRLLGRTTARIQQPATLGVVGGVSLVLALGVAFLPWLFPAELFRPMSAVLGSPLVIVLFGLVAGLFGAQALRRTATDAANEGPDLGRWTPTRAPEKAYSEEYRITGTQIDSVFESESDDARDLDASKREARKRIRGTAISVLANDESISTEAAVEQITAGSWTNNPRAAAFLGGRHLAPLRTRIRDWASGEQFERWATHAVTEIEARERGERDRMKSESRTKSEEARR